MTEDWGLRAEAWGLRTDVSSSALCLLQICVASIAGVSLETGGGGAGQGWLRGKSRASDVSWMALVMMLIFYVFAGLVTKAFLEQAPEPRLWSMLPSACEEGRCLPSPCSASCTSSWRSLWRRGWWRLRRPRLSWWAGWRRPV